jgi:hypothetical protein
MISIEGVNIDTPPKWVLYLEETSPPLETKKYTPWQSSSTLEKACEK